MITIQILTKNNDKTIRKALESVLFLKPRIVVIDYGSVDDTLNICEEFKAKIIPVSGMNRNEARILASSDSGWNLWIEPWEILLKKIDMTKMIDSNFGYVRIIQNNILNWEIRLWNKKCNIINPVFETIETKQKIDFTSGILSSHGGVNLSEHVDLLEKWISFDPLSKSPYYYKCCLLLSEGKYDDFIEMSKHYLFLDKTNSVSSLMIRYYLSIVFLTQKKMIVPTLQNINMCLCKKPLMAEFWCVLGDVYYHLMNNFYFAKEFYENAIVLGSKRLDKDIFPMDIKKYKKYPELMIDSCNKILNKESNYKKLKNTV
jgi:glycosyltransferase involved in cell wall biosynthesis